MELNTFRVIVLVVLALLPPLFFRPKLLTYFYLGLILFFPQVLGFGVLKQTEYLSFYAAGTGMLVRPLISFFLLGLFVVSLFMYRNNKSALRDCNVVKILLVLSLYYLLYALWGIATGVPIPSVVSGDSTIHLLDMTLFMVIMLRFCSDEKELQRLSTFLIFCVASRELFGLFRFLLFSGDISNVYHNIEGINIKLTFQDINDSLLACLIGYYCAWTFLFKRHQLRVRTQIVYLSVIALSLVTILFSYRRSAWLGLCLAGVWFVLKQPLRRRIQVGIAGGFVAAFTFTTLLTMRLGRYASRGHSLLLYDITGKHGEITAKTGRFSELLRGWEAIKENLLFGVGPWGEISSLGGQEYIHGGVLQIWLKIGLLGLVLFLLATVAFIVFYFRKSRKLKPEQRGWYEAGFAGVLFLVPTFLVGTPVVEYRTMQLSALCLALPFITYAIYKRKGEADISPLPRNAVNNSAN